MAVDRLASVLLFAAPGLPAGLALLWPVPRLRPVSTALAPWAALPALALSVIHLLEPGGAPSVGWEGFATGLRLRVDPVGGAFLFLTALLWTAAGAYARAHRRTDAARDRFFAFFSLTLAGNVGAVLAVDLLTFYLAFAVMTFAAYGLVAHTGDPPALRAGKVYIVLALLGEACILTGLLALGHAAAGGGLSFGPEVEEAWGTLRSVGLEGGLEWHPLRWAPLVAGLFVVGFGVKIGVVPLHVWLPLAHPVAPTAASALLSGVMIEVGVLGWIRVLPHEVGLGPLGSALVVVGVATAFHGVVSGVAQDDPKTVLAYSSISQMGYLALGMGLLLLSPDLAPLALAAVVLFALHHGVAKACLFLAVGVAKAAPGIRRRRAVLFGAGLAGLVLTGAPLTSGAVAKKSLEAPLEAVGGSWYVVLDPLLSLAAVGTTLLMARYLVTLQRASGAGSGDASSWTGLVVPWALLLIAALTAPAWLTDVFSLPDGAPHPSPWADAISSTWPVAVGAGIALGVLRAPPFVRSLLTLRVPPGDVLVPVERVLGRVEIPDPARRLAGLGRRARTARRGARDGIGVLDAMELGFVRILSAGSLLAALAGVLFVALTCG